MPSVSRCEVPPGTLLSAYVRGGSFADCYAIEAPGLISHAQFVEAFYTSRLFKVERFLLRLVRRSSSDVDASNLAHFGANAFAAWKVESREEDQLLLADFTGRTRSWLMVKQVGPKKGSTWLYFGSAVVGAERPGAEQTSLGTMFILLLGFHKLYSRALLKAAQLKLASRHPVRRAGHV